MMMMMVAIIIIIIIIRRRRRRRRRRIKNGNKCSLLLPVSTILIMHEWPYVFFGFLINEITFSVCKTKMFFQL